MTRPDQTTTVDALLAAQPQRQPQPRRVLQPRPDAGPIELRTTGVLARLALSIHHANELYWRPGFRTSISEGGTDLIVHHSAQALLEALIHTVQVGGEAQLLTAERRLGPFLGPNGDVSLACSVELAAQTGKQWHDVFVSDCLDRVKASGIAETIQLRRQLWCDAVNSCTSRLHVVRD